MRLRRARLIAVASAVAAAGVCALRVTDVFAAPCADGSTCPPATLTVGASASLLATVSGSVTAPGSFTASYRESVFSDPTNEFCNGCLDWVLQVSNSSRSSDTLQRLNISNFAGFIVDIGVNSNGASGFPSPGTAPPTSVARNTTGKVVTWNFEGGGEVQPGKTTVRLEAETNALTYQPGLISFQDGGATQAAGFAPAAPKQGIPDVPWVASFGGIAGAAAAGTAWLMSRRRRPSLQ